ncbi:MAG: RNA-binding domain-containing protein [Promethearchaeota archaeon]
MSLEVKVTAQTPLLPTENVEKVKTALLNMVNVDADNVHIEEVDDHSEMIVSGEGQDTLQKLHTLFREKRILGAARRTLRRGIRDHRIYFYLNKQAAFVGNPSFVDEFTNESPLGPIEIEISTNNPEKLIDWLAPRTRNGKIISERTY